MVNRLESRVGEELWVCGKWMREKVCKNTKAWTEDGAVSYSCHFSVFNESVHKVQSPKQTLVSCAKSLHWAEKQYSQHYSAARHRLYILLMLLKPKASSDWRDMSMHERTLRASHAHTTVTVSPQPQVNEFIIKRKTRRKLSDKQTHPSTTKLPTTLSFYSKQHSICDILRRSHYIQCCHHFAWHRISQKAQLFPTAINSLAMCPDTSRNTQNNNMTNASVSWSHWSFYLVHVTS